jgi:hypothetical protein
VTNITVKEIYEQQYEHFRSMNGLLYQMPIIFSTILGGLWYFAASYLGKDRIVSTGVFVFAAIAAVCFTIALQRFRLAFNGYIDNLNKFDGEYRVTLKQSALPSTLAAMIFLVMSAAFVSVAGAVYAIVYPAHETTEWLHVILGH